MNLRVRLPDSIETMYIFGVGASWVLYVYICTCIYVHIYIYTHTYTHIHQWENHCCCKWKSTAFFGLKIWTLMINDWRDTFVVWKKIWRQKKIQKLYGNFIELDKFNENILWNNRLPHSTKSYQLSGIDWKNWRLNIFKKGK